MKLNQTSYKFNNLSIINEKLEKQIYIAGLQSLWNVECFYFWMK